MPRSSLGSIPCCWAIFCTSKPMCFRNWMTLISCPVSWSRIVGQEGLQWGHGQLSIKCNGQPLAGGVLCWWWRWRWRLLPLVWIWSWRLRSQQWRALGREVPFTWMSIQSLQGQEVRVRRVIYTLLQREMCMHALFYMIMGLLSELKQIQCHTMIELCNMRM